MSVQAIAVSFDLPPTVDGPFWSPAEPSESRNSNYRCQAAGVQTTEAGETPFVHFSIQSLGLLQIK